MASTLPIQKDISLDIKDFIVYIEPPQKLFAILRTKEMKWNFVYQAYQMKQ